VIARSTMLIWLAAGCAGGKGGDGDGEPDFPRACDQSALDGDCVEYTGAGWVEGDVVSNCEGGALAPLCPPESVVGWCTIDAGTEFETVTAFYVPFWTAPTGVQACQGQGGSWEVAE
jgi:hypothetical protein